MRLIGAVIVLALVLFLALSSLTATHVTRRAPVTGANAQGIVNQARSQVQQSESAGQTQLQRGLDQVGAQP